MLYILSKFLDYNYCLHLSITYTKFMAYFSFFQALCVMDGESLMNFVIRLIWLCYISV